MAGIYIHIPFCKRACHYCDFHFSTNYRFQDKTIQAIRDELVLRKDYLKNQPISTIYFGGGTPSSLPAKDLNAILTDISNLFNIDNEVEITLEANPDDLNTKNLSAWKDMGVNRLSIGVQSFINVDLIWMNRMHNAKQALEGIERAKIAGFENITIDLIYGLPNLDTEGWKKNLNTFFSLNIPHLSAYSLTVEPGTHLHYLTTVKNLSVSPDKKVNEQFDILMNAMADRGFEHYEISNFSKPGMHSKHNTSYWQGEHYLGIGPSAHSFDGHCRQWNIKSNSKYTASLSRGIILSETEHLSLNNRYNEYLLTGLRTKWGVSENKILSLFGAKYQNFFKLQVEGFLVQNLIAKNAAMYTLTNKGKFLADNITSNLFIVD